MALVCNWVELHNNYLFFIIIGDFNSEFSEEAMNEFCCLDNLKNLMHKPTCFKNSDNPSCMDLILTNRSRSFQSTSIIDTYLSDSRRLTVTVMKMNYIKQTPKIVYYRNYKHFNNELFRSMLVQELDKLDMLNLECKEFGKRYIRANNAPFMTKELCVINT